MPIVAADILLQSSQNPGTIWRRAEWSLPCSARFTSLLKHYAKRSIFAANRPYYRGSSSTVNSELQPRNRKPLLWGVSVVVIGAFVATNPFYAPDVSLDLCIAAGSVFFPTLAVLGFVIVFSSVFS